MHFYRELFSAGPDNEETLTTVETFCMEVIHAMKRPTINEFASFIRISQPNAAYKVNNLIRKGYLTKTRSTKDKREYFLEVTPKYIEYCNASEHFMKDVCSRLEKRISAEDARKLEEIFSMVSEEMMAEVPDYRPKKEG
jgi:DNA-binding MarR family transcriptional regulator